MATTEASLTPFGRAVMRLLGEQGRTLAWLRGQFQPEPISETTMWRKLRKRDGFTLEEAYQIAYALGVDLAALGVDAPGDLLAQMRLAEPEPGPRVSETAPGFHVDARRLPELPPAAVAIVFRYLAERAEAGQSLPALFEELEFFLSPTTMRAYSALVKNASSESDRTAAAIELAVRQHRTAYDELKRPPDAQPAAPSGSPQLVPTGSHTMRGAKIEPKDVPVPRPALKKDPNN